MEYRNPLRVRLRRFLTRLRYSRWLGPLVGRLQPADDFRWASYTEDAYRRELGGQDAERTLVLAAADWSVEDGRVLIRGGKPLHPNHAVLYEALLGLAPASVCEFGCGGGDHLANSRALLPDARVTGVDVSAGQLAFARERHAFGDDVRLLQRDMTRVDAVDATLADSADVVYTQAVLMHIHGGRRPETFLRNMWRVSRRYLVLIENWRRHPYGKLFRRAFPQCTPHYLARDGAVAVVFDKRNALEHLPPLESVEQLA